MKYELTNETKIVNGITLHRIRRLHDDQVGGWVAGEHNLSQEGECWVGNDAQVYDNARVCVMTRACTVVQKLWTTLW